MQNMLQITRTVWRYGGLLLLVALASGHGMIWYGVGALIYLLITSVLIWATRVPTMEEEERRNAKWLADINSDYKRVRSVEDRLDELERLKRRDMVTLEEYAAKRQEILKNL